MSTVAGTTCCGLFGPDQRADNGPATAAKLSAPNGVAVDSDGNIYIADTSDNRVRRIDVATGIITTFAGGGEPADGVGDGLPATQARIFAPWDVAVDAAGNVYITDSSRVRRVDTATGIITTVVGTGTMGYSGDGGPATQAQITNAQGLAFDAAGNLYIADVSNVVRKVSPGADGVITGASDEIITTVAGTGTAGYSGDGGPATQAQLSVPIDVTVDAAGNLYIADRDNNVVRRVDPVTGIISTVAGGGSPADGLGDGLPATDAQLAHPAGLAIDAAGNLYISDQDHNRVRRVDAVTGIITTYAGTGDCSFDPPHGDGRPATQAQLCAPARLDVDAAGNLFIADNQHHRIRVVGALSITKADAPEPVPTGGLLTYTLSVGNFSTITANSVTVTDALPAGVGFVSVNSSKGTCIQADGTVTCNLGRLAPNTGAIVRIRVTAPATAGVLTNTASFVADHPDTVTVDDSATEDTMVGEAHLELTKVSTPDPVRVNKVLTYKLTAFNALPTPATEVTVTDTLPTGFTFISATPSQGSCSEAGGVVTCQLGDIAYQGSATVKIQVRPTRTGTFTNTATVASNEAPTPVSVDAQTRVSAANCGRVVTANTTLKADIGPCGLGDGVIIGADGITLDLGGHRIFGFPQPGSGNEVGIRLPNRHNVTVRNGTVSGFDAGVLIRAGGSNTVTGITARENIGPDDPAADLGDGLVIFDSPANRIVGNTFVHNGVFDGIGVIGPDSDDNVIEDNVVEDTVGTSDGGPTGQGIIVSASTGFDHADLVITNVRIAGNTVRRNASAGIANLNNVGGRVLRNIVEDNGFTNANGNGIGVQVSPGFFSDMQTRMLVRGNEVHGNAQDGIRVVANAHGNRILNNDAADNNVAGYWDGFDLHDESPDCDSNTWFGNKWGSGGYSPPCTTAGGTGPNPPTAAAASSTAAAMRAPANAPDRATPVPRHLPSD